MTIEQAAAPDGALVPLVAAIVFGALLLFPSLGILFRLTLRGTFSASPRRRSPMPATGNVEWQRTRSGAAAIALLAVGTPLLVLGERDWMHATGSIALTAFILFALHALNPGASEQD